MGRDGEISRLCLIASEVRSQRTGRIVLLIGEPGMGKTRLLEELRYRERDPAPCVLEAAFYEAERHRPLAPVLDATRGALTEWQPPGVDAAAPDREQLFETLAGLIRRGADEQGMGLLVLDDAHLCDPSSSELLHYIVRTTARTPLLTVAACRPAELEDNSELSRALRALRRRHLVDEIHLRPLAKDALRTLVTAEAPLASIERLVNESAGNPLLALEMASALPEGDEVPRTLTDLVLARMATLSQDTRALVRWAAIFERGPVIRESAAAAEALMQISTRIREGGEGAWAHAAIALAHDSLDEARPELTEALKQLHGLDDKRRLAWVANRWARREREGGDCDLAKRLATDALQAAQAVEALSEAAMAACELMAAATLSSDDQGYAEAEETLAGRAGGGGHALVRGSPAHPAHNRGTRPQRGDRGGGSDLMELVIVERVYDEALSDEHAEELRRKAGPCFRMRRVKHLKMYLSKDRLRAICLYEAPDAATVREAHEQEGFAYAKIWSASTYCSPDAEET